MTRPYFPIEITQTLDTLGFPIVYYAPLMFDAIKVNGNYAGLYDALDQDCEQSSLETVIELYDAASNYLLTYILARPCLHRLLTADIDDIEVDPRIPDTWIVTFTDCESTVDIARDMFAPLYPLRHIGVR
jgi:hypothetical protein